MTDSQHPAHIGRYQIQRLIGAGGMGDVYLARDPNIERQLAIKTVRLRGAPAEVADHKRRLLREAKAAGRLVHPHVVTLFDAGEADGVLYLAFEFVDGPDLGRRMKAPPPLTLRHALTLVRQIADGLSFAHHQGIIHRDIKPSNILIDPRGQAKIADFGLAKMNDESVELTRSGSVVGSPQYMSPEQVRGEALDGRTDIFSLGVLLYELMSSLRPFGGQTISTLVYEILSKEPLELGQLRPDLPADIATLVRQMMAKDLNHRLVDAGQIVTRLDGVLATTPAPLLDAPAVRPVDDTAPTELMPKTPTPGPLVPPVAPGASSATLVTPPPRPPAPAPSTGSAPVVPHSQTAPHLQTAAPPPPPRAPMQPTQPMAPLPPPPVASSGSGAAGPVASGSGPQGVAVDGRQGKGSSKSILWLLGLLGGFLLLAMAGGIWWASSWLEQRAERAEEAFQQVEEALEEAAREEGAPADEATVQDAIASGDPDVGSVDGAAEDGSDEGVGAGSESNDPSVASSRLGVDAPSDDGARTLTQLQPLERRSSTASRRTPPSEPPPTTRSSPPASPAATPPSPSPRPAPPTSTETPPSSPPAGGVAPHVEAFDAAAAKAQQEMDTGLFFKFAIEPKDAIVRSWQRGEERQRVLGRVEEYAAKGRGGRSVELPGEGDYLLTFIADGYPDYVVWVHATSGGGGGPQIIRASLANPSSGPSALRVSKSLAFDGTPADARVLIDGVEQGPASRWPGGLRPTGPRNLQLEPGRHRLRIEADGYTPYEIEVVVGPGARRAETVRFNLRRANR